MPIRSTILGSAIAVSSLVPFASAAQPRGDAENLVRSATVTASTMAAKEADGKYGVPRLCDGNLKTRWASRRQSKLPQWIKTKWPEPVKIDTVTINAYWAADFYAVWTKIEVEFSDGAVVQHDLGASPTDSVIIRLDKAHTITWAVLRVVEVVEPKANLGIKELGFYLDPHRRIGPPKQTIKPRSRSALKAEGRPEHPTVYVTRSDVLRARRHAAETAWGKAEKANILDQAGQWLEHDEAYWLQFLPRPGDCYACGFARCPICRASLGKCRWDRPRTVACRKGHVLPDAEHPDDGTGYTAASKHTNGMRT